MHDPYTLAHRIVLPIPVKRWTPSKAAKRANGFHRRRRSNEENLGEPVYPWWRPAGWEFWWNGQRWGLYQLATIWHVDPEADGSDDSCDWFNHKRKRTPEEKELAEAISVAACIFENPPHWITSDQASEEYRCFAAIQKAARPILVRPSRTHWWQIHPRWHFWHWRVVIHPLSSFKRWLFVRCGECGGRIKPSAVTVARWVERRRETVHTECYHSVCRRSER